MTLAEVRELAMKLSTSERAELAQELMDTLDPGEDCTAEEWEEACGRLLQERLARLDSGESVPRDWRESMADIRERLRRKWQS